MSKSVNNKHAETHWVLPSKQAYGQLLEKERKVLVSGEGFSQYTLKQLVFISRLVRAVKG